MMQDTSSRVTIVCPAALIDGLNAAVSLAVVDANWRDESGEMFAVVSFIPDGPLDLSSLDALKAQTLHAEGDLYLVHDRIQIVHGGSGLSILERLQLSPILPVC